MIRRVLHWPLSRRSMSTPSSNNSQLLSSLSETAAVKPLKKPERKKSAIRRAGGPVPVQPAIAATSLDLASVGFLIFFCILFFIEKIIVLLYCCEIIIVFLNNDITPNRIFSYLF
jgi:hypothetical protein